MSLILRSAVDAYLDAADHAKAWSDARFTDEANRSERARLSKPARETLAGRIETARAQAMADRAAYTDAIGKALHDDSDNNRVLARELAWQRLVKRAERGELLTAIARTATPVELEALAAFAPAEMPYLESNNSRTPAEWRELVDEVVGEAYTTHPANAERFGPLAKKAAQADATLALADLGSALVNGQPMDGSLSNRVYNIDADLYRRVAQAPIV